MSKFRNMSIREEVYLLLKEEAEATHRTVPLMLEHIVRLYLKEKEAKEG